MGTKRWREGAALARVAAANEPGEAAAPEDIDGADAFTAAFAASMPQSYRDAFDRTAVREHAHIVGRRSTAAAHAEVWCALPYGGAIACVVADDRPGLLSLISAALVVNALDITSAQVYGRRAPGGGTEIVDFFWLERAKAGGIAKVEPAEVSAMGKLLDALLRGRLDIDAVVRLAARTPREPPGDRTHVRFARGSGKVVTELVIETRNRPGLLFAITRALFNQRVQIVRSEVRTPAGRAQDRFEIVEFDGGRVKPARFDAIEAELRQAIDSLARGTTA